MKTTEDATIELSSDDLVFVLDGEFQQVEICFSADEIEAMDENKVVPTDAESFSLIFGY